MKPIILLLGLCPLIIAQANTFDDSTQEGHQFATSQKGYLDGLAGGSDSRAFQYGGQSTISAGADPCLQANTQGQKICGGSAIDGNSNPEKYYGQSAAQLQSTATVQAASDPMAQYVKQAHSQRPTYSLIRQDELVKYEEANQSAMVKLSQSYQGCQDIAYGGTTTIQQNQICHKTGMAQYRTIGCNRVWTYQCSNGVSPSFSSSDLTLTGSPLEISVNGNDWYIGSPTDFRTASCAIFDSAVSFNITDIHMISSFQIQDMKWDDSFFVAINDKVVEQAYGAAMGVDPNGPQCEFSHIWANQTVIDILPYLQNGTNTLRFWNKVGGGGTIFSHLHYDGLPCLGQQVYVETCDAGIDKTKASLISSTCTDNRRWTLNHQQCWHYRDLYRVEDQPLYSEEPLCQDLRSRGCAFNGSTCELMNPSGWCQSATLHFICSVNAPKKTLSICGDTLVCPDGHCDDQVKSPTVDNTKDFARSSSYLAAMDDMRQHFDFQNMSVWKGDYLECSVDGTLIGSNKCCSGGKGFLNTLGVKCSANEMKINMAKQDGRVTPVGQYTSGSHCFTGKCMVTTQHYQFCVWPSRLARIVQDQGRPLLGQKVANPCPGFRLQSPNEFSAIDWGKIDLSEYYADVMAHYRTVPPPDGNSVVQQMQQQNDALNNELSQKLKQYGKQ